MIVLGIETSCDETAASIAKNSKNSAIILSDVTATSAGLHARTGGVIPEEAARKQLEVVIPVIDLAIKDADISIEEIDAIAVTYGPGLIGSLLVGVETAKTLSYLWNKPLIPVNHLIAHIYANWIAKTGEDFALPKFPAIALVVSGGHTDLVVMKNHGDITWIGGTRDDAAGEAFDKTARLLGLPYPGGPSLAKVADKFLSKNKDNKLDMFPRPMINDSSFDWSFSGLKTAVLRKTEELYSQERDNDFKLSDYKKISIDKNIEANKEELAAQTQEAIVNSLVTKTIKAIKKYNPKSFVIAGGVSANKRLRESFFSEFSACKMKTLFHVPGLRYCTDNAAMIATCAIYNPHPISWKRINANPQIEIVKDRGV